MLQSQPLEQRASRTLSAVFFDMRGAFIGVALFSFVVNILMLTGPLFMLQVYDRVLTSRSVPTLLALFGLVAAMFLFMGFFDLLRQRVLSRIGMRLDTKLMGQSFKTWVYQGLGDRFSNARPLSDLTTLRQFMSSPGIPALFDLPWAPIYLAIVYLLHVQLGLLATVGALVVLVVALSNEYFTRNPMAEASVHELQASAFADRSHRNAEAIVALGMMRDVTRYWEELRLNGAGLSQIGGERAEGFTSFSKAFRLLIQSAILGLGAYLAILQEISPGTIIAASILAGRALAPIDQTIGNWRNILRSRQAYERLNDQLNTAQQPSTKLSLPAPKGFLTVARIAKAIEINPGRDAPADRLGSRRVVLQGINFQLKPGDAMGVIGPSASGKSSLARLLVGLWMPDQGSVRLDGATLDQWDSDALGHHIGYLPQSVELIAGPIHQNIARFDSDAKDDEIVEAAKLAGVHDLILSLPDGYATEIGPGRMHLSGGQVQRIALARALFRNPALVVLDEPNSNLDAEGDHALARSIARLREQGSTVVVMAHRPSAIASVNLLLILSGGRQVEFGHKEDVLRMQTRPAAE